MEPPHAESLFQRLPVELRLQIYDLLFPTETVPYHAFARGSLRHDASPTCTKILRLNRDTHAEAAAYLYARTAFQVRITPGGIVLCGGRHMTYPAFDFGKHGGPAKIFAVEAWDGLLRNVRRVELRLSAWVQPNLFDMVVAYVRFFISRLLDEGAPLDQLRVSVDWQNGVANFPRQADGQLAEWRCQFPSVGQRSTGRMALLLQPLALLRGLRDVRIGRVDPLPVGFASSAGSVMEQYAELRVVEGWLRGEMTRSRWQ